MIRLSVMSRASRWVLLAMLAFTAGCRWGAGELTSQRSTVTQQRTSNDEAQVIVQVIHQD